jgi:hypothetical protein
LNKEYLKPHDTINAIVKSDGHYHGSVDMTWGFPTEKKPTTDAFVVSGSKGWLTINNSWAPPLVKIVIASNKASAEEKDQVVQEVIEEAGRGVEVELRSFFDAVSGKDDGLGLGNPREALVDVAFIQAALTSDGSLVDLRKLVAA